MGGRGAGANPEKMFVCAVSSCYTATLFAVLRRRSFGSTRWQSPPAEP
jgi:organic hydroperoxide reductase OsmC/OhrA